MPSLRAFTSHLPSHAVRSPLPTAVRPNSSTGRTASHPVRAAAREDGVDAARVSSSAARIAAPASSSSTDAAPSVSLVDVQTTGACCHGRSRNLGEYSRLSGIIEDRSPVGIGGEAPPSGPYLVLSKPVAVRIPGETPESSKVETVHALFVETGAELVAGQKYQLNGRLDRRTFGGVERPLQSVFAFTGVTNVAPGNEPRYDGRDFTNGAEEVLVKLSYNAPLAYDAPAKLIVLDRSAGQAFIGSFGGFIPPDRNPFHGFNGSAPIESPTDADRAAVDFGADGQPVDRESREPLELIGTEGEGATHPDAMSTRWFFSPRLESAFALQSGGIAGFQNHMSAVVRTAHPETPVEG